jgi:hypothetical protein
MLDVGNAFISSKSPFQGVSLEDVKESDIIWIESISGSSRKEQKEIHSASCGTDQNAFCLVEERFLNRAEIILWWDRTAKNTFLWTWNIFPRVRTLSLNYRKRFPSERQVSIFSWTRFLPLFFMDIFHWAHTHVFCVYSGRIRSMTIRNQCRTLNHTKAKWL